MNRIAMAKLAFVIILMAISLLICGPQPTTADEPEQLRETKRLGVRSLSPGKLDTVVELDVPGGVSSKFTVPPNRILVISRVEVVPELPGPGTFATTLWQIRNDDRRSFLEYWVGPYDRATQLDFPGGMVIGPESSLALENDSGSGGPIRVTLYGYIQASK